MKLSTIAGISEKWFVIVLSSIGSFGFFIMLDFLIELTIGYVYVWKRGALE